MSTDLFRAVSKELISHGYERISCKKKRHPFQFVKDSRKIVVPINLHDKGMARTILKQAGIQPR
jgi:hypothetical protein